MTDITDTSEFDDADPEETWDDGDFFEQKLDALTALVDELREKRDERFEQRRALAERLAVELDAVKNVLTATLASLRDDLAALE